MSRFFKYSLLLGAILVGGLTVSPATANEPLPTTAPVLEKDPGQANLSAAPTADYETTLQQIRSIQELRDVSPVDWSYQALRNLVENYGCIVGYPDRTYRGDRPLSRNEFAAGLNACLEQLERRLVQVQSGNQSRGTSPFPPSTQAIPLERGDTLQTIFNRAFFNETLTFWDSTDLSGQVNGIFGVRYAPGSFFDNQIANDGKTFQTVYRDALNQQTAGPRILTPDLPNPFNTSIQSNPSYLRTTSPEPGEINIRMQQIPIVP
ncbi:S-layer domain protein [Rippkaea orientalis PCC 8801]|uniref:S-layer domain protein n=1 Tax=Rippkaea orientalis (strain PCC 8801 / RF-1) TaxID=41431 RepID=B7K1J2_RIPO1|nr:iron uptake porin [Rippkaea orientalis]ACK67534.1 S-layer domain protein [Rippkaea orientalis PCC 8801]